MSTAKRAYDMLRGYVNTEWERIKGVDMNDAELELTSSLSNPVSSATSPSAQATPAASPSDPALARQILGVSEGASFTEIRACFERIVKRTDPANFPAGSAEGAQAEMIHRRVHRAYAVLTEGMDATEKRFRTLEID